MELTLFILVGTIAVVAAAMMLISENAVHSALFLVLNFACIAFFFLMLNAPFLAMVQIVVYAGAIMVLFLFVIMLLGAERLTPETRPRFPWLTPVAVVLALMFLITTGLAIIQGEIDLTSPKLETPEARVVHVLDDVSEIDVYLDNELITSSLDYGEATDFSAYDAGRYELTVYAAGQSPEDTEALVTRPVDLVAGEAATLAVIGTESAPLVTVAVENVAGIDQGDELRVMAINAFPESPLVDVVRGSNPESGEVLIDDLPYGEVSAPIDMIAGDYTISLYDAGAMETRLMLLEGQELNGKQAVLWIFTTEHQPDNSWDERLVSLQTKTRASFGSPAYVGQQLFVSYVLPFEIVGLVLLTAMIGTIVLTKEALGSRRRIVRQLANPPAGLEKPIVGGGSGE